MYSHRKILLYKYIIAREGVYIPVRGVITRLLMGTRNIDIEDESPYFLPRRRRSDIVFSALTRMNPLYISTFLYAYGSTKASYVIFPLQNGSSLLHRDRRLKRIVKIKIITLGGEEKGFVLKFIHAIYTKLDGGLSSGS